MQYSLIQKLLWLVFPYSGCGMYSQGVHYTDCEPTASLLASLTSLVAAVSKQNCSTIVFYLRGLKDQFGVIIDEK